MAKRNYSNWIEAYLRHTDHTEAPMAFHLWTAVSTIAGALRRSVYIDQKSFEWVPNFYIFLVGPAGLVTKSTSLLIGEKILRGLKTKVKFGSSSGSWQALAEEIQHSARAAFGGVTTCSVSYYISELGTFLDPTNREQIDFFVSSWDAQRQAYTRVTKSGGKLEIPCPCLNLIAGTTPVWIKENFTPTMIGGGFVSRLIFVKGNAKRRLIAYPALESSDDEFRIREEKLIQDLLTISSMEGPMKLTAEAIEWGKTWYEKHWTEKRQLSGERFDGFYARKQTHMHKLAMIYSVAEGDSMTVTLEHLKKANNTLLIVEKDLASIIDNVTSKQISTLHKRELLSIIAAEGSIDRDELYQHLFQMMSITDFERALADLTRARQLTIRPVSGKTLLSLKDDVKILPVDAKKGEAK